jgi:ABC-type glutathione transport system ATPase component
VIVAKGLTRVFVRRRGLFGRPDAVRAVDEVDLELEKGEVFGLVGKSGSGKTTLGLMLCGALDPSSGEVGSAEPGRVIRSHMVFQDPRESLNPRMKVLEIVAEPLLASGVPRAEREARAGQALEKVRLEPESAGRFPHELSGGQRQRVAIARASISNPDLVVADEPTSMLDATVASEVLSLLESLAREEGSALLLITHDLAQAAGVCDRIGVMHEGKLVETGDPLSLCLSPGTPPARELVEASRKRELPLARRDGR